MTKKTNHTEHWRQRLSLLLVFVFCLLVSASEYYPVSDVDDQSTQQEPTKKDSTDGNQTYLNVDVDAVIPFVAGLATQIFHLIYETVSFEPPVLSGHSVSIPLNFPYWEILLERIISPNAP